MKSVEFKMKSVAFKMKSVEFKMKMVYIPTLFSRPETVKIVPQKQGYVIVI